MTSKEKLQAIVKLMEAEQRTMQQMQDVTEIRFPKDGRALVYHDGFIRQIPEWKLKEQLSK